MASEVSVNSEGPTVPLLLTTYNVLDTAQETIDNGAAFVYDVRTRERHTI